MLIKDDLDWVTIYNLHCVVTVTVNQMINPLTKQLINKLYWFLGGYETNGLSQVFDFNWPTS